ncbi:MAG: trifunctional transcriptional regulator/proline dehydrogenase/L-glutamate gamma-semialdehyde dehydrogenase [Acidisphaera sp.]|nr:trifunctional transcriptional regulator/proline dehydrogenase/L-glutamate gamma-semialdehyde dehydrogenase [Acidisphaera sp.]
MPERGEQHAHPFAEFARSVRTQPVLRAAITAAYRRAEPECVPGLLAEAELPPEQAAAAEALARRLVGALRAKRTGGGVEGLIHEFALSSQEGVALMCLAEALLRIPDAPTRDSLIRDKISGGDWQSHLGRGRSLFVNAATWGLMITGRLVATSSETGLSAALTRLIGRGGEPVIRGGVDLAMRLMGEHFVRGQTIEEALAASRRWEARGFRYSYDMLGEAALTAADAARYEEAYRHAITAIGAAAAGRGLFDGPGISVKLSALHPRYTRAQRGRVMGELAERLRSIALLARRHDVGLNIDAEEADRLELSLDLLEALCADPALAGWNGIGFVVQAYQKRARPLIDYLIDLAERTDRRLMVRLVKGAYWDTEIKRAQADGLKDFPVFTRKVHTDVSYLACARRMLAAPEAIFPQFATHNAQTVAALHAMAGPGFEVGRYEFQCLHGMGEPLYEEVVGPAGLNRPCRIYAPVGTHATLLAYLVRRLLENGANTSFVHRVTDASVPIAELVADPVAVARTVDPPGSPHPRIRLPRDIADGRTNSTGLDLSDEQCLAALAPALRAGGERQHVAAPMLAAGAGEAAGAAREVRNPADPRDLVGLVTDADDAAIGAALDAAAAGFPAWSGRPSAERAEVLLRAAETIGGRMPSLLALLVREGGKALPSAVAEVREAVDFLRYYAQQARDTLTHADQPLGVVVCISPWNFPLAIFIGQVAAALAAGNTVLAKPAEETPLIAARAVRLLHESGVPADALQLLPGDGAVGAKLVGDARAKAVMFTGSTEVAQHIRRSLARRLDTRRLPVLVAETGGQNAMVVDSSALPEQAVSDILASAFDSAGQRCSALRILCLQDDVADHVLDMLKGAAAELRVGNPDRLSTDIGPVINQAAQRRLLDHLAAMRARGYSVHQAELPAACARGSFVAPTLIEIPSIGVLPGEVFGPVLHVLRYRRDALDALIDAINATGYGLTFGVHTRIDETVAHLAARISAGNVYVNRNMIGAAVGMQPFGGRLLSGTGPKAGGPLYLRRLCIPRPPPENDVPPADAIAPVLAWRDRLHEKGFGQAAARCEAFLRRSPLRHALDLPAPAGEQNRYFLEPRGTVLCVADSPTARWLQVSACLATGNRALVADGHPSPSGDPLAGLPPVLRDRVTTAADWSAAAFDCVLYAGPPAALQALDAAIAARPGPIVPVQGLDAAALESGAEDYALEWLMQERSISTNTAAAGGNASLMTIG